MRSYYVQFIQFFLPYIHIYLNQLVAGGARELNTYSY